MSFLSLRFESDTDQDIITAKMMLPLNEYEAVNLYRLGISKNNLGSTIDDLIEIFNTFEFLKIAPTGVTRAIDQRVAYVSWILPASMAQALHDKFLYEDRAHIGDLITRLGLKR